MFGEPGHLYVYLSYGMHCCANLVTRPAGIAGAVLLRAAAVEEGEPTVRRRRGADVTTARLLSGPGNLCRGLGIGLEDNGLDAAGAGRLRVRAGDGRAPLATGPRVGISSAADLPLRFWWRGHPAVSQKKKGPDRAGP